MSKFNNKYRIESCRAQWWDYGWKGAYFITICTQNRVHFFGQVVNGEMQLNGPGQLASQYWQEIPTQFPYIELANFVVMPNHIYGILIVDKPDGNGAGMGDKPNPSGNTAAPPSPPPHRISPPSGNRFKIRFFPQ